MLYKSHKLDQSLPMASDSALFKTLSKYGTVCSPLCLPLGCLASAQLGVGLVHSHSLLIPVSHLCNFISIIKRLGENEAPPERLAIKIIPPTSALPSISISVVNWQFLEAWQHCSLDKEWGEDSSLLTWSQMRLPFRLITAKRNIHGPGGKHAVRLALTIIRETGGKAQELIAMKLD